MAPRQIIINALHISAFLAVTGAVAAYAQSPASQITMALDWQRCTVIEEDEASNTVVRRCDKSGGPDIYVAEVMRHFFVGYGPEGQKQKAFNQSLLPFNSVNDTVVLRARHGEAPYAAILRYFTENETHTVRGQILVITKLQGSEACHMAYVDAEANSNADTLAEQTADVMAPAFDCNRDEPKIVGESGKSPL